MKLLIATNNQHKITEIRQILNNTKNKGDIELLSLADCNLSTFEVEETGNTFKENAFIKSSFYYEKSKIACIADDSGLEIEYLDMKPGIYSARFAGIHGNDAANRHKVLDMLNNIADDNRKAQFRCVICFFDGSNNQFFEGIVKGKIATKEAGINGFGYDPIFIPDAYDKTFAELNPELKNFLSHRALALNSFAKWLNI